MKDYTQVKVLVVDDDEVNLIVAAQMLADFGIGADMAQSGAKALEMCAEKAYDMVLMDHLMPEMDGAQTTKALRRMGMKMPVIAVSANRVTGEEPWFVDCGMNDSIGKPMDYDALERVLGRWLDVGGAQAKSGAQKRVGTGLAGIYTDLVEQCGLDASMAVEVLGGSEESYMTVLHTFNRNLKDTVNKLLISLDSEDWHTFMIKVHGCKSALMSIGAVWLSERARRLEQAAIEQDLEYLAREHAPFLEDLELLKCQLDRLLPSLVVEKDKSQPGNKEQLAMDLIKVNTLLEDLENEEACQVLDNLLGVYYGDDVDGKLQMIREHVENFNYDDAAADILSILAAI